MSFLFYIEMENIPAVVLVIRPID